MTSTYVKVYDDLEDHPGWQEIDALAESVGLWTLALIYCGRNRTDGHFPARMAARRWAGSEAAISELLAGGRWHAPGHDCPDCPQPAEGQLYLHAYLERQRSREQIDALSEKRREAGRAGGNARVAKHVAKPAGSPAEQTPSRVKPDTDTDTDTKKDSRSRETAAAAAEFDTWWESYPHKVGKAQAAKAYAKARKTVDAEALLAGLANAAAVWTAERRERQFIPHPATWLNRGSWEDEVPLPNMPDQPAQRVTLRQCSSSEPHGRHVWEDARNRYGCQGAEA